jgi:riboflavin kinase/FMN adenylyltransferase
MKVFINKSNALTKGSVCGIGSFDGVHRGHQAIVEHLKNLVHLKQKVGIITFIPLPFFVLKKASIFYLTPQKEKEKIFGDMGVDFIYYFTFTRKFAELEPAEFVQIIKNKIQPSIIAVGENFHFGKGRGGTAQFLKQNARNVFTVEILKSLEDEGTISSTRIRELLLLGHIKAANRLLGREYMISGRIMKGKGKGAQIGFPTINVKVPKDKLLPLDGVYKVRVSYDKYDLLGAMFCRHTIVEVHLISFSGNLYHKNVVIKVLERIRDIKEFSDDSALKAAIASDVKKIKR